MRKGCKTETTRREDKLKKPPHMTLARTCAEEVSQVCIESKARLADAPTVDTCHGQHNAHPVCESLALCVTPEVWIVIV